MRQLSTQPRFDPSVLGRESPLDRVRHRSATALRTRHNASRPLSTPSPATSGTQVASTKQRTLSAAESRLVTELLADPIDYIDHPEYHLPGAAARIYAAAEITRPDVTWYHPLMDDFVASRDRTPRPAKSHSTVLLTGAQECILFMKYNFARFSMSEIQKSVASRALTASEARELLRWNSIAKQYREQLVETNLALVLAMARRVHLSDADFADLIGEGNMALMRSVDKFDCARGFKFSTYGCRAILKAFSRHGMKITTQRKRFGAEFDPLLERSNHIETVRATHERECASEVKHIVVANKAELSELEIQVLSHRFGLDVSAPVEFTVDARVSTVPAEPLTLEQVGQVIGVTKERVRQIQNKALEKIRSALAAANPTASNEMRAELRAREGRTSSLTN